MSAPLTAREQARRHQALMENWYSRARGLRVDVERMACPGIPAPVAKVDALPILHADAREVVSYEAAHAYAVRAGLIRRNQPLDLHAVNHYRNGIGLPEFVLMGAD